MHMHMQCSKSIYICTNLHTKCTSFSFLSALSLVSFLDFIVSTVLFCMDSIACKSKFIDSVKQRCDALFSDIKSANYIRLIVIVCAKHLPFRSTKGSFSYIIRHILLEINFQWKVPCIFRFVASKQKRKPFQFEFEFCVSSTYTNTRTTDKIKCVILYIEKLFSTRFHIWKFGIGSW